jgi:signal transduction histidine kinase/CHASE1-domain containing sensor protein
MVSRLWKKIGTAFAIHRIIPSALFMGSMALTLLATVYVYHQSYERDLARFQLEVLTVSKGIVGTVDNYVALLDAQTGFFAAVNNQVSQTSFKQFSHRIGLEERYPGVQGMGFTYKIPQGQETIFEQQLKSTLDPAFQLFPKSPRDEYHAILYLEPHDARNLAAIGYDMFSEPIRRKAMEQARDTGKAVMSGKVTLVQEIDEDIQPGFLIYVPIYRSVSIPETVTERREQLLGFAYSPFRAGDLFMNMLEDMQASQLTFAIYDGDRIETDALLFKSFDPQAGLPQLAWLPRFREITTIYLYDNTWTLEVHPSQTFFVYSQYRNAFIIFGSGLIFSGLLYWLSLAQSRSQAATLLAEARLAQRYKAQKVIADIGQKALEVRELEELTQYVVTSITDILDVDYATIMQYKPLTKSFTIVSGQGWSHNIMQPYQNELSVEVAPLAYYAITNQETVVLSDIKTESRFDISPILKKHEVKSGIAVLIYGKNKQKYGVISVYSRQIHPFRAVDIELIQAAANILSLVIEQHEIEKERLRYEQHKDEFIAVASHELKTPVTSIKAFGHVLSKMFERKLDHKTKKILALMNNQVDKLTFLVTSLLDISRIESGKLVLSMSEFDYDKMLEEIVGALQLTIPTHTIQWTTRLQEKLISDRERVEQVLINFINNAAKYSADGTVIKITSERVGKMIKTSVHDSGIGIFSSEQQKIFQRFYRVSDEERKTYSGLGLGLYISKQLIVRLGGEVGVSSTPGKGSTFWFTLPLASKTKKRTQSHKK